MRGAIAVSRHSKICNILGPHANMHRRPETQGKHSACAVAPSLPDTLADCAPPRGRPHHRFSTVDNRSHQLPAPTCMQVSVSPGIPEVSIQPAPSHHRSPTRSQTVRGHGLGPITVSRRSKIGYVDQPRQHACKPQYDRIREVSKQPALPHHDLLTHSRRLCEAAGTVPTPLLDNRKSVTSA